MALSTAEADYTAMSSATQEALALTDCYKPRTKHIDVHCHFLRDNIVKSQIKFVFVKSCNMVADNLTKGTVLDKHLFCNHRMGLHSGGDVRK